MGALGIWYWLIVLFILAIPLGLVGGLVWLIVRLARPTVPRATTNALPGSTESRLKTLSTLLLEGHITQGEYERQRIEIISGV